MKRYIRTVESELSAPTGNVGIWWLYNNKVAKSMKCSTNEGVTVNGIIQYSEKQLPKGIVNLIKSYGTFGRVVYDIRSQVYEIICSQAVASDENAIKSVADKFDISDLRYDVIPKIYNKSIKEI